MAVSWYTPTNQRFSDPSKHARLYHALEPLFTTTLVGKLGEKPNEETLNITKQWALDKHVTSGIVRHRTYHEELRKLLPALTGDHIVFIAGTTIDRARENPSYLGIDYASPRNVLTGNILNVVKSLQKAYGWDLHEDVHFIPVMPLVLPFHATLEGTLEHSLAPAVTATEMRTEKPFGNTTLDPANPDFRRGIFQYSSSVIDAHHAQAILGKKLMGWILKYQQGKKLSDEKMAELKRLFPKTSLSEVERPDLNRAIRKDTDFNRAIFAAAYATIVDKLQLKTLHCYLSKSSSEYAIMQSVAKITHTTVDDWNVMRNSKMSPLKEADPAALRLLEGKLYYFFSKGEFVEKKDSLQPHVVVSPTYNLPDPCSRLACMRCPHAAPKCACDFAEGNYTEADVIEVLKAKGSKESPAHLLETFNQLHTPITYLDENGHIQRKKGIDILLEDNEEQGWTFMDIEQDIQRLQNTDATISRIGFNGEYATDSWQRFLKTPITPLIVPESRPDVYSVRPSEFSNPCPVGRILSKIDVHKVEQATGEPIIPHKWGLAGTMRHALALWRPWVDYAGRKQTPMWDYTERRVWAQIVNRDPLPGELASINISGQEDGSLSANNLPLNWDYKRSPNQKPSYSVQQTLYMNGTTRILELPFEGILVLINRPHFGGPREQKTPLYNITYVDQRSFDVMPFPEIDVRTGKKSWVHGIEKIVVGSYRTQRAICRDKESYLSAQKQCCNTTCTGGNGECGHPFNSQLCNSVKKLVAGGRDVREFLSSGIII